MDARLTSLSIPPYVPIFLHFIHLGSKVLAPQKAVQSFLKGFRHFWSLVYYCIVQYTTSLLCTNEYWTSFWVLLGFSTLKTKLMRQNWTLQLGMFTITFWNFWLFFVHQNNTQNVPYLLSIFFFLAHRFALYLLGNLQMEWRRNWKAILIIL